MWLRLQGVVRRVFEILQAAPASISCRLSAEDLVERQDAWQAVRARVEVVDRTRFDGGFRLELRGHDDDLEEVARLVDAERECCDWASWRLERKPGNTTLTVSGDEELIAPLATAMFQG